MYRLCTTHVPPSEPYSRKGFWAFVPDLPRFSPYYIVVHA
nr:MAG TPA: hypothetical protein [Caudoviricetes sp.]